MPCCGGCSNGACPDSFPRVHLYYSITAAGVGGVSRPGDAWSVPHLSIIWRIGITARVSMEATHVQETRRCIFTLVGQATGLGTLGALLAACSGQGGAAAGT